MPNSLNSKRARSQSLTVKADSRQNRDKREKDEASHTRDMILDSAEKEFAEKGIAGARVEQIAIRAGVAKALIYYYFEGKHQLLQAIVDRTLKDNVSIKRSAMKADGGEQDPFEILMKSSMSFMRKRKDVLRILLLELLKKEDTDISMLQVMDRMFSSVQGVGAFFPGLNELTLEEMRLPIFLFGSLPFCLLFLLEDKWIEHYKVEKTALEKEFFETYKKTFGEYIGKLITKGSKGAVR